MIQFFSFIIDALISLFCKKMKKIEPVEVNNMNAHHDFVPVKITEKDKGLLKEFKIENRIIEDDWGYRKGAVYTAYFGLADGWGANMEPGYVRIHPGVDRARGGSVTHGNKTIKDIVICPFNFDETGFYDYNGKSYGTLIFLTNNKYQFDLRVAHMHPERDIIPWALRQFKAKNPYKQNWLIGSAGTYGYSTGAHTHTELVSHDESCEIFELLLIEQFGEDAVYKEYDNEFIYNQYKTRSKFEDATEGEIFNNWAELKKKRRIIFINQFKYIFYWNNQIFTRYATDKVIKGL